MLLEIGDEQVVVDVTDLFTTDVPVLGVLPFEPEADTLEDVLETCEKCFDCKQLLQLLGLDGEVQR